MRRCLPEECLVGAVRRRRVEEADGGDEWSRSRRMGFV